MTNEKKKMNEIYSAVTSAVEEWLNNNCLNNGNALRRKINSQLDRSVSEIVAKLLGFDNHWNGGRWEVDHCNGRSGNSVAGDYIKKHAGAAVNEWLEKQAGNLDNIKLNARAIKSLKSEAKKEFEKQVRQQIQVKAKNRAEKFVAEMFDKIKLDENQIKDATKAVEFVNLFSEHIVDKEEE